MQSKRKVKRPARMCRQPVFSTKSLIFHINDEWVNASEAAEIARTSRQTINTWCNKYGIGIKVGRNYRIDPVKLREFMEKNVQPCVEKDTNTGAGTKRHKCPYGYKFGLDYDEKPRCEKCNQIIWLHCGRKNEKTYFAECALLKSEKLYTKSKLKRKIKEMEERL